MDSKDLKRRRFGRDMEGSHKYSEIWGTRNTGCFRPTSFFGQATTPYNPYILMHLAQFLSYQPYQTNHMSDHPLIGSFICKSRNPAKNFPFCLSITIYFFMAQCSSHLRREGSTRQGNGETILDLRGCGKCHIVSEQITGARFRRRRCRGSRIRHRNDFLPIRQNTSHFDFYANHPTVDTIMIIINQPSFLFNCGHATL